MILSGRRFAFVVGVAFATRHSAVGLRDLLNARVSVHALWLIRHGRGGLVTQVSIVSICIRIHHGYVGLEPLLLVKTLQIALGVSIFCDVVAGNVLVACGDEAIVPTGLLAAHHPAGFGRARQIPLLRALLSTVLLDLLYVLS